MLLNWTLLRVKDKFNKSITVQYAVTRAEFWVFLGFFVGVAVFFHKSVEEED